MKQKIRLVSAVIATALWAGFTSCDGGGDAPDMQTVKVTITNLPAALGTDGIQGQLVVYSAKPVQFEGLPDGVTTGVLMNGSADLLPLDPRSGGVGIYAGGEGYLRIKTAAGLPQANAPEKVYNFVSKNKVTLKPGNNTFDFGNDFEILHEYGGEYGIIRITGVPKEVLDVNGPFQFIVTDYPGMTDEGDAVFELAMDAKPLALTGDYTTDYLSIPVNRVINQVYDQVGEFWTFEFTEERFQRNGMYFVYSAIDSRLGYDLIYASQVVFTSGNVTISWNDLKKVKTDYIN